MDDNSAVIELLEEGLRKIPARSEPYDQDQKGRFAAGFKALLEGMLTLARNDIAEWHMRLVRVPGEPSVFPFYPESSRMVVLSTPSRRECRSVYKTLFASDGKLGLRAVTFHESGEVGLLLPQWVRASSQEVNAHIYTVVTIRMDGYAKAHLYRPVLDVNDLLRHALGTADQYYPVENNGGSGAIDSMVGFPGAADFLANALPKLGVYFEELAQEL